MTRFVLTTFLGLGLLAPLAARADPAPVPPEVAPFAAAMAAYRDRASLDRHREAQQAFVRWARERPTDHDAQIWCARTSFYVAHRLVQADDKAGCAKAAEAGAQCAERAQVIRPRDYDGRYWELMNRFKAGATMSWTSALRAAKPMRAALEELIARDPRRPEGHLFLALAYRELPSVISWGDNKKAMESALKAFDLAPRDPEVLLEMAESYRVNGEKDLARQFYRRVAGSDVPVDLEWETEDARRWARKQLADLD